MHSKEMSFLGSIHTCDLLGVNYFQFRIFHNFAVMNFSLQLKVDQMATVNVPT